MMYKLKISNREYATIYKDGKEIVPLSGLFMASLSEAMLLDELVRLANRGAAEHRVHLTCGRRRSEGEKRDRR